MKANGVSLKIWKWWTSMRWPGAVKMPPPPSPPTNDDEGQWVGSGGGGVAWSQSGRIRRAPVTEKTEPKTKTVFWCWILQLWCLILQLRKSCRNFHFKGCTELQYSTLYLYWVQFMCSRMGQYYNLGKQNIWMDCGQNTKTKVEKALSLLWDLA